MSTPLDVLRRRVEAQGFRGLDDATLHALKYWLRFSPAVCLAWAALAMAMQSATVLWWLLPFAALGAVLPIHPFDYVYVFGLRRLVGGPPMPRYSLPRRSACALAALMITGAAWALQSGHAATGNLVGWTLVAAALVQVTTGFCVPSFLYGALFGRPEGSAGARWRDVCS